MTETAKEARPVGAGSPASKQVSWWPTHEFLDAALAQANAGPLPMAGTPAWGALSDNDPRKVLALAAAGEHHVLRMETAQLALAQAAEDVHGGENWSEVAQQVRRRREIDALRRSA